MLQKEKLVCICHITIKVYKYPGILATTLLVSKQMFQVSNILTNELRKKNVIFTIFFLKDDVIFKESEAVFKICDLLSVFFYTGN